MEAKTDTTSTTSVAYKLNFYTRQQRLDLAPGEDLDYDAWLVEFPNSGSVYFSIPPLPGHNIGSDTQVVMAYNSYGKGLTAIFSCYN